MGTIEDKLATAGVDLHPPMPTAGAYAPVVIDGNLVYTSGMLGVRDMKLANPGCAGADLELDDAKQSAREACITVLSALHHELGTLDRIERILRVTGYVRAASDFQALPSIVDGASELLIEVFGEPGRHTRAAIGVAALPGGGSVELDLVARLRAT